MRLRRADGRVGPRKRVWGFYLPHPDGWYPEDVYDKLVRSQRRDLWNEGPEGSRIDDGEARG